MLRSYLLRHYKIILMLALFCLVFAAVFTLYDLEVEAVLYASLLCLCIGAALFFLGFMQYCRRHKELQELLGSVTLTLEGLPAPKGALERDYQRLLKTLYGEMSRVRVQADTERRDQMDYYTLWAHQIKTPIAAMRLLLQTQEDEQNLALYAELTKIEQYADMVLSYLRLDSESSDYVLREYDLDDVVRQSVRKFARLFILKKLPVDFRETGLTVLTDSKWLAFILEQLLSNSLKYTASGKIAIYAEGTDLIVSDTGIGIRAEDLSRVFEKGFTGYNGREHSKATGIGLYLCRRVCDKLGHGIEITSSPGHGTAVRLKLGRTNRVTE